MYVVEDSQMREMVGWEVGWEEEWEEGEWLAPSGGAAFFFLCPRLERDMLTSLDNRRALEGMVGLLTTNADFRVMDCYSPKANVTPALRPPFQWLNDAWQIGESAPPYRFGFISKLHDMIRFYELERNGGDFLCLGKRHGGSQQEVKQTVMESETGMSGRQKERQQRAYDRRFDEFSEALQRGTRVFFVYYNKSSGVSGSHWTVSVYVLRGQIHSDAARLHTYYFDSFGNNPTGEIEKLHNEYDILLWRAFGHSAARKGTYSQNTEDWQGRQTDSSIDCGVWICWCMLQTILFNVLSGSGDIAAFMKTRYALLQTHFESAPTRQRGKMMRVHSTEASLDSLIFRELFFRVPRLRLLVVLFGTGKWEMLVTDLRRIHKGERVLLTETSDALLSTIRADHPDLVCGAPKGFEINHPSASVRTDSFLLRYYDTLLRQSIRWPHRLPSHSALYNINDFTILVVVDRIMTVE